MLTQQLQAWNNFYVIVGSAAAGLTGLMFVVVSLSTRMEGRREEGVRAFVTPTVVYFATVLAVSAVMTIPTLGVNALGLVLTLGGTGLLAYTFAVRTHKLWKESDLGRDDWAAYVALPVLCYALITVSGACIWLRASFGLELLGVTAILLLLAGIRNAWDLVIWMVQQQKKED